MIATRPGGSSTSHRDSPSVFDRDQLGLTAPIEQRMGARGVLPRRDVPEPTPGSYAVDMMQRVLLRVDGQEFETITIDEATADQLVVDLQESLTRDTVVDFPLNALVAGELRHQATVSVAGHNVTTLLVRVEPSQYQTAGDAAGGDSVGSDSAVGNEAAGHRAGGLG